MRVNSVSFVVLLAITAGTRDASASNKEAWLDRFNDERDESNLRGAAKEQYTNLAGKLEMLIDREEHAEEFAGKLETMLAHEEEEESLSRIREEETHYTEDLAGKLGMLLDKHEEEKAAASLFDENDDHAAAATNKNEDHANLGGGDRVEDNNIETTTNLGDIEMLLDETMKHGDIEKNSGEQHPVVAAEETRLSAAKETLRDDYAAVTKKITVPGMKQKAHLALGMLPPPLNLLSLTVRNGEE